eukprot:TRINITY_DN10818_c0_g1_i1.p1 TRINITY_DN10818_c0_g1~~TRINITY_DN10818_c0_g1_i1.p1  ORF type:complete len:183 (-),score=36.35 TRINITY_DN10818_c0_g1_i1:47-550(-)
MLLRTSLSLQSRTHSYNKLNNRGYKRSNYSMKPEAGFTSFGSRIEGKAPRPISPHLLIYKIPLPGISSIMNRGAALVVAGGVVTVSAMSISSEPAAVLECIQNMNGFLKFDIKLLLSYTMVYHVLATARHWYWDFSAKGLETKETYYTLSRALILVSLGLAVVLALL